MLFHADAAACQKAEESKPNSARPKWRFQCKPKHRFITVPSPTTILIVSNCISQPKLFADNSKKQFNSSFEPNKTGGL